MEGESPRESASPPPVSLASFLSWAAELRITDFTTNSTVASSTSSCLGHSLTVADFPDSGGRGLAAARDLRTGELVLTVPKASLMTRDSLMEKDPKFASAVSRHPSLSSSQILAIGLLVEVGKGKRSYWYPYLLQLPRQYDILAGFGPFESKALQAEEAVWTAQKAASMAELHWRGATRLMEELTIKPRLRTFKAWLWAEATISSRTLHIPWDDAGCLCPVGDFFNYAAPGVDMYGLEGLQSCQNASSWQVNSLENKDHAEPFLLDARPYEAFSGRLTDGGYEENIAAYCFYAKKNYKKGDQVLLSYGTYTNLELLEHYGFLLDKNPNDKVFIPLGPDMSASDRWPADSCFIHHDGRPSFSMLCALRLWATPVNQRKNLARLVFSGSQLSPRNESTVMSCIASKCKSMLGNLPSRVDDDIVLLQAISDAQDLTSLLEVGKQLHPAVALELTDFLKSNCVLDEDIKGNWELRETVKRSLDIWRLAVQWRIGYKKILVDCISFCSQIVHRLSPSNTTVNNVEACSSCFGFSQNVT
ncbi:hypothetical protein Droror1_Dr00022963 [Drosera rotundifolia]